MKKKISILLILMFSTAISCSPDITHRREDNVIPESSSEETVTETNDKEPGNKFIACWVNGNIHDGYLEFDISKGAEFEVITEQNTYLGSTFHQPYNIFEGYEYRHDSNSKADPPAEFANDFFSIKQIDPRSYIITVKPMSDYDYVYTSISFYPLEDLSYCFGKVNFVCQ